VQVQRPEPVERVKLKPGWSLQKQRAAPVGRANLLVALEDAGLGQAGQAVLDRVGTGLAHPSTCSSSPREARMICWRLTKRSTIRSMMASENRGSRYKSR
jgi:hypothetical protein